MRSTKANLRRKHLKRRKSMAFEQVRELSQKAQARVLELPQFRHARTVGLYSPVDNEVQTCLLREWALEHGTVVGYPSVVKQQMDFVRSSTECVWIPGAFDILEPRIFTDNYDECVIRPECMDVVVIPGVAFDPSGGRLGYGKGFYDRFLPQCKAGCALVGLAYDFQLEERLPCEHHDVGLDYVITDAQIIECAANR
jgi:5-formyltetrahydrofolate cyclo-ligase